MWCVHLRIWKAGKQRGPPLSWPALFAVKEAVAKALGTGFRTFMPIDVEVLRDDMGKPYVRLYRGALKRFQEMGMERLEVSITNTREYAMAFAVGEGRIKEVQPNEDAGNGKTDEGH